MVYETLARVEGPNVTLRLIRPQDVDYVQGLRIDLDHNRHLSEVRGMADGQRPSIEAYEARDTALRKLCDEPALASKRGAAGPEFVLSMFPHATFFRRLGDLIAERA